MFHFYFIFNKLPARETCFEGKTFVREFLPDPFRRFQHNYRNAKGSLVHPPLV